MNLRVAHHGEDQEMDVVEDGPISAKKSSGMRSLYCWDDQHPFCKSPDCGCDCHTADGSEGVTDMAASLLRAIQRDPNPRGRWKKAILSTDGTELMIDTADGRTFIATIREVS